MMRRGSWTSRTVSNPVSEQSCSYVQRLRRCGWIWLMRKPASPGLSSESIAGSHQLPGLSPGTDLPVAQVDVMKKEGLTLRQRITRDKEAASLAGSTSKMGKFYYQQMWELYEGANPCEKLPVSSPDEPEEPLLKTALISFVKVSTSTSQLTEWCCMVPEVNQTSVCALFRQLLRTYPAQNMIIATLICDVMKMVVRIGLDTKYPAEVKAMTSHFDIALLKTFVNFKANNLSTQL